MNFSHLAACMFMVLMATSLSAKEAVQKKAKIFEDQKLSIQLPKGAKVQADPANNKYIFFFDHGFLHISLIGPKEDLKASHQRAETALKALHDAGINKPIQQGNAIVTVKEVSKISDLKAGEAKFATLSFVGHTESKEHTGDAISMIGYGSVNQRAIWFTHVSEVINQHAATTQQLLETLTVK